MREYYEPKEYQKAGIRFGVTRPAAGFFLAPGLGKTSIILFIFKILKKLGLVDELIVLAKRRIVYEVWPEEIEKWEQLHKLKFIIAHGKDKRQKLFEKADVRLLNYEGLQMLAERRRRRWQLSKLGKRFFKRGKRLMLAVDECFSAGTLVSTNVGYRAIETLSVGNHVLGSDGRYYPIRTVYKKTSTAVVRVELTNGSIISCTPNHPLFTEHGWICAGNLTVGIILYAKTITTSDEASLSLLQKDILYEVPIENETKEILRSILQSERIQEKMGCRQDVPPKAVREHESAEVSTSLEHGKKVEHENAKEDKQNTAKEDSEGLCDAARKESWWERAYLEDTRNAWQSIEQALDNGTSNSIGRKAAWLSNMLQSRLGMARKENSDRGRWASHGLDAPSCEKERRQTSNIRVARISYTELDSAENVYDLEIDGPPHYFANGCLVHNSSKLRHTKTSRFKALKECLKYFSRRYILTGSPVPQSLENLFGQVYTLDYGAALGTYITQFRNEYFYPAGFGGYDWRLQKGAEKRIFAKLRPLVLRYGNDQLNLPPLTFVDRFVTLDKKARYLYDEMEEEYIIRWQNDEIVAANAAVATGKCRQIASGGVYYTKSGDFTSDPKKARGVKEIHDVKCEELVELLEELEGEPALVTYEFGHDVTRLKKYFKKHAPQFKDAPFVGGGMKDKEFAVYKKMWNRGELPVMFGQPESVAHGLNLQGKGGIVIFFSLTWNLENYEQFIQRVWRQGQKRRVIVYRIIARDTVDVDMIMALKKKDRTQQALLKAMEKRVWKKAA